MHCFNGEWLIQILVWIVIVCTAIALLKLLAAFLLPRLGLAGEVVAFIVAALRIIIIAIICIFAIYFIGLEYICQHFLMMVSISFLIDRIGRY